MNRVVDALGPDADPDVFVRQSARRTLDAFNQSSISTVVCVALTSNLKWADAPGNVVLPARATGLPTQSVANVTQLVTLDKGVLAERSGKLSRSRLELVLSGLDTLLGRRP